MCKQNGFTLWLDHAEKNVVKGDGGRMMVLARAPQQTAKTEIKYISTNYAGLCLKTEDTHMPFAQVYKSMQR